MRNQNALQPLKPFYWDLRVALVTQLYHEELSKLAACLELLFLDRRFASPIIDRRVTKIPELWYVEHSAFDFPHDSISLEYTTGIQSLLFIEIQTKAFDLRDVCVRKSARDTSHCLHIVWRHSAAKGLVWGDMQELH